MNTMLYAAALVYKQIKRKMRSNELSALFHFINISLAPTVMERA